MTECSFGAAPTVGRNGPVIAVELGERVLSALYEENSGNPYRRMNAIRGRALDALIFGAIGFDVEEIDQ